VKLVKGVKTSKKTFTSANILTVEVGTNTPMGGDAGHGGKTIFRIVNEGATAWTLKLKDQYGNDHEVEDVNEVTIELYGDTEADTFVNALLFAVTELVKTRFVVV